jgi:hypothetical protein
MHGTDLAICQGTGQQCHAPFVPGMAAASVEPLELEAELHGAAVQCTCADVSTSLDLTSSLGIKVEALVR